MPLFSVLSFAARVATPDPLVTLVGESPAMTALRATLRKVAPHKATVLVRGESGTGKEVVARALHALSPRAPRRSWRSTAAPSRRRSSSPSCSGTRKGAFTDAVRDRAGPASSRPAAGRCSSTRSASCRRRSQVKLLRVLQDGARPARSARDADVVGRRARRRRDLARPRGEVAAGRVPRGPALSPRRADGRVPPLRDARRRRRAARGPLPRARARGCGAAVTARALRARGARRARGATPGPATCASSRTRSSAPPCCATAPPSTPRALPERVAAARRRGDAAAAACGRARGAVDQARRAPHRGGPHPARPRAHAAATAPAPPSCSRSASARCSTRSRNTGYSAVLAVGFDRPAQSL